MPCNECERRLLCRLGVDGISVVIGFVCVRNNKLHSDQEMEPDLNCMTCSVMSVNTRTMLLHVV